MHFSSWAAASGWQICVWQIFEDKSISFDLHVVAKSIKGGELKQRFFVHAKV